MARPRRTLPLAAALGAALATLACGAPPWTPPGLALRLAGGGRSWQEDGRRRAAVHAGLVLRLEERARPIPDARSPPPAARRRSRCAALHAVRASSAEPALAAAALQARGRALGCEVGP